MLLMCCQRPPGAVFSAWRFRRHCWYVRVSTVVRHNLSSLPSWKNCVYIFLQHNGAAPPGLYVHVTVHRDMWPCIVTCDRASCHVTVHRVMWPCIVTSDRASWHVTVHRNKFLFNKTNKKHEFSKFYFVKKLYMFRAFPLPIIRSFLLYIRHWYISCRFDDSFQAGSGWNCVPSWPCLEAAIKPARNIPMSNVQ